MKKALLAAAAIVALPAVGQAQGLQYPGFYIGAEGGANWMLNTTINVPNFGTAANMYPELGWLAGAVVGYDFVGPRVELEGVFRRNEMQVSNPNAFNFRAAQEQIGVMVNGYYDFNAGGVIVPYIGAGVGVSFVKLYAGNSVNESTQFAYQGMLGLGWNVSPMFRVNLEGRYHGTTAPTINNPFIGGVTYQNNNISAMLSLHVRFGAPVMAAAPPPPPPQPQAPTFMVFFDWDRSNLSAQALNTIKQAANAFKAKGQARITATGHADKSGPDQYNMALSLRRANAVKDALVREGVPATAIAVVGRGESMPLVQTADGVREPQNRRVEIVVQ